MAESDWIDDPEIASGESDWLDDDDVAKSGPSVAESGVRGVVQGASAGFSDELSGGLEALGSVVGLRGLGKDFGEQSFESPELDLEQLKSIYESQRNAYRDKLKADAETNPITSVATNVAGSIVSPLNKIVPGSMVKQGVALGGVNSLGMSEADNVVDLAKDTAIGMGLGGGLGFLAKKASPFIEEGTNKVGEFLKERAEGLAARALGAERGTVKKLGVDKVRDAGRYALDEGLLSPFASTDDIVARNSAKMTEGANKMNQAYSAIDDAGASTFNPLEMASKVDEELGSFYRSPINRGETNQLENTLEAILMRGDKNLPLSEAQALKRELGKVANWKNTMNITDKERMARQAYGIVSAGIDDAAEAGAQNIGVDGVVDLLKEGRKMYARGAGAETMLENKLAREQGNKLLGLTDWGVIGAGGGAAPFTGLASIPATAAAVAGKKYLEKYGVQQGALGLDAISKSLLKSPKMLDFYNKNPAGFQSLVNQLEQKAGMFEGTVLPRAAEEPSAAIDQDTIMKRLENSPYSAALSNAAQNGEQSFAAAHYVLSQRDPEYSKLME